MLIMLWQQAGYMMIIYISGIATIPEELNEAAGIDGASPWQRFWHVTLPMLRPSVTICTFLTLTNGFKLFDQNLALTGGMPSGRSELLALNIYHTFYGRAGWEGAGQAKAVVFCVIVVSIAFLQLRLTQRGEVEA
jgi:raffinose/stachyose/melibiose transport system permease protein